LSAIWTARVGKYIDGFAYISVTCPMCGVRHSSGNRLIGPSQLISGNQSFACDTSDGRDGVPGNIMWGNPT